MNKFRFAQLKRKAREEHEGIPHKSGKKAKYVFTEEMDERIRDTYDSKRETIEMLVRAFGFPDYAIKQRATILGVTRFRPRNWTADEINFLKQNLHLLSLSTLAQKLGRSETAIRLKAKRLRINKGDRGFTQRSLCEVLGVDHHKVEYWRAQGWLIGMRRNTKRTTFDYWHFDPEDVRSFIVGHPYEVNLRRVEPLTFIEILTGAEIVESVK